MSDWIPTANELPPIGKFVLATGPMPTWVVDDPGARCVVIKRIETDQTANSAYPFKYVTFGPSSFSAEDITHWQEINMKNFPVIRGL
jgi:hypothetical protein